jgi:hypothetical protein
MCLKSISFQFSSFLTLPYIVMGEEIVLSCPEHEKISFIRFASFGTPQQLPLHSSWNTKTSEVPKTQFFLGRCHAGSSLHVMEQLCLNQQSCHMKVRSSEFGDNNNVDNECAKFTKRLAVQYYCTQ